MTRILIIALNVFVCTTLAAQKKNKIALELNYGCNGNFFVRSYEEVSPFSTKNFFNKNFLGTIGGIEMKYDLNKKSRLGFGYARSINSKEISYTGNYIGVQIRDWHITHTDKFFQIFCEKDFSKKMSFLKYHGGIFYLRSNQQEILIKDRPNGGISYEERNYKNSYLEEGGVFLGVQFSRYIDTKFELGIRTRIYFLISTVEFNNLTLTPVLTYHF